MIIIKPIKKSRNILTAQSLENYIHKQNVRMSNCFSVETNDARIIDIKVTRFHYSKRMQKGHYMFPYILHTYIPKK